jgi:fumarylpyruvate hydrolase
MGSDPNREPPFFFQTPSDAVQLVPPGQTVDHPYPSLTKNYHYEVELLAALNRGGRNIPIEGALKHVYGYAIGLYMTRRDWQRARATRKSPGKSARALTSRRRSDHCIRSPSVGHFTQGNIWLKANRQVKQNADLKQMIRSVAEQISKMSGAFESMPGDIIYSGTPENVGPVVRGDAMEGHIDGLPNLSVKVV